MAFKGTERRSARAIAEEIEAVGGHLNAYTSRESTAYYAKVLKEDLPLALDILADILLNSSFDPAEFERERTVILQEIGQANDTPDDIIFDHFQERAFPDQAMGRPTLGSPRSFRRLSRDSVIAYLRDHYGAARMVLSASGNLDHDRFVDLAEKLLSAMPAERAITTEPARYIGGEYRQGATSNSCIWCSVFRAWRSATRLLRRLGAVDRVWRRHVVPALPGGAREARSGLHDPFLRPQLSRRRPLWHLCRTGEADAEELMPVLCDETMRLADGLTEIELARAKAQMKAGS